MAGFEVILYGRFWVIPEVCKWNALNDAERYAKGECDVIPVYVPLHRFAQSVPQTFDEAFLVDVPLSSLIHQSKGRRNDKTRLRIYADGLDEIPPEHQKSVVLLLHQGMSRVDSQIRMQILLTARDHVTGEWLAWLARVSIERLDSARIKLLVSQLLNHDELRIQQFFEQLSIVPSLQHLMGVGLLATLVVALFTGMTKLPEGRTELYRIFVDLMCGGWDLAKGLQRSSAFPSSYKQRVLTQLASRLHRARLREATAAMLREIVVNEAAHVHKGNWEGFVADMIQDGLLLREGSAFIFSHLSFQEYLCARDLADPVARDPLLAVREYMKGQEWWHEVATFYLAMSQRPTEIRRVLDRIVDDIDPGRVREEAGQAAINRRDTLLKSLRGEISEPVTNRKGGAQGSD